MVHSNVGCGGVVDNEVGWGVVHSNVGWGWGVVDSDVGWGWGVVIVMLAGV